jgi:GcrA cell cycle regulator
VSAAEDIRDRIQHLVSRNWPIERLAALYQARADNVPIDEIARRFGISQGGFVYASQRLFAAGVLSPRNTEWSEQANDRFCKLYNEGLSIGEIGRRMGITKSASVGKSQRLVAKGMIPARPKHPGNFTPEERERRRALAMSPQDKAAKDRERWRLRNAARTADRREAQVSRPEAPAAPRAAPKLPPTPRLAPLALNRPLVSHPKPKAAERAPYAPPAIYGRVAQCCWPIGDPGTRAFHFCDKPTDPGRPYCQTHVGKAYVRGPAQPREVRA